MTETANVLQATSVGLRDRRSDGWFDAQAGELLPGVRITPGMRVVDVGCGDGGHIAFCGRMGADISFIDRQESKVRALEQRLQNSVAGDMEALVSDCNPIPLPDGYADLVICTEVLEHVADPTQFLTEIVRLGKADASFVLTVPDARSEELVATTAPPSYFEPPNHIRTFTSEQFRQLVEECGLQVQRQEFIGAFWAIFFLLKWGTSEAGEGLVDNVHPATLHWTQTWDAIMAHPNGDKMRAALNQALPKCQVIVASKLHVHPR